MSDTEEVKLDAVVTRENLEAAWAAVKANDGAAGVDRKTIKETAAHLKRHWAGIRDKLLNGAYQPAAVRAVEIPKGNGGSRRLGIPTEQDRLIQQALHQIMSAAFDGQMSEHSYGFRPKRSAHDAVSAARSHVAQGKNWVVDIDLKSFFDQVNHDRLMNLLSRKIADKRVLKLIGRYLRAPMRHADGRQKRDKREPRKEAPSVRCWPTSTWTHWTTNWKDAASTSCAMPTILPCSYPASERPSGYWKASRRGCVSSSTLRSAKTKAEQNEAKKASC